MRFPGLSLLFFIIASFMFGIDLWSRHVEKLALIKNAQEARSRLPSPWLVCSGTRTHSVKEIKKLRPLFPGELIADENWKVWLGSGTEMGQWITGVEANFRCVEENQHEAIKASIASEYYCTDCDYAGQGCQTSIGRCDK